jgi:hypothetical protein
MSSTADNLSAVLDAAREELPEGDYLKVANFLPSLLKKDEVTPYNVCVHNDLNITLDFETVNGKEYNIKIDKVSVSMFRGSNPNITTINGSINDVSFVDMNESKLIKKIKTIVVICGMVKIKRTVDDIVEEWEHFTEYKKHQYQITFGSDDDYDEDDYCDIKTEYYAGHLICSPLWDPYV